MCSRPDYYIGGIAPKVEIIPLVENKLAIPPMQEIITGNGTRCIACGKNIEICSFFVDLTIYCNNGNIIIT